MTRALEIRDAAAAAACIPGWMQPRELHWLADRAARLREPATWYELGSWCGRSAYAVGTLLPPGSRLVLVDIFEPRQRDWPAPMGEPDDRLDPCDPRSIQRYLERVTMPAIAARNGIAMELRVGPSVPTAAAVSDGKADAVFIDAGHELDEVLADIAAWAPKLKPGGLFAGHDYAPEWPGVIEAVDAMLPERRLLEGSGIWYVDRFVNGDRLHVSAVR
ncbi:MAG: class I SAM-dependent methyltransferase [Vicinamibacterales bacterium]